MRFNWYANRICVQLLDLTKICVLNMVTWDLTGRWTENVSKYKIEQTSVYITWKTWDLTERWNENEFKCRIELKSVYITWKTWDLTERWDENASK